MRILVPLDGTPTSELILPVAEKLAAAAEAELILLRAVLVIDLPRGEERMETEVRLVTKAEQYLRSVSERLERRGCRRVRWTVWYNEAVTAIVESAKREQVDLIAMATHGRRGLAKLVFGSVAETVSRRAEVPVLLVKAADVAQKTEPQGTVLSQV